MNDIMKKIKSLEEFGLLIKGVRETIKNAKRPKVGFLSMLSGTLGVSLIESLLTGKRTTGANESTIIAGQDI